MGTFSVTHWAILLAVVVIVFGTGKLKNAGADIGGALKGFKDAVEEDTNISKNTDSQLIQHDVTHVTKVKNADNKMA